MAITIVDMVATTIHLVTTQATILQLDTIQATLMDQGIAATHTQLATTPIMELGITLQLRTQLGPIQATRIRQDITLQLRTQLGPIQATRIRQDITQGRTRILQQLSTF